MFMSFLDACSYLYKKVSPSIRLSVCWLVCRLIGPLCLRKKKRKKKNAFLGTFQLRECHASSKMLSEMQIEGLSLSIFSCITPI